MPPGAGAGRTTRRPEAAALVSVADDVQQRAAPRCRGGSAVSSFAAAADVVVPELEEVAEVGRRGELLGQRDATPRRRRPRPRP